MALVEMQIKGNTHLVIQDMRKDAHKAHMNAIRKSLAMAERHHKRKEWVTGGTGKNASPPHPTKLSVREGHLKRSYHSIIVAKELYGSYGSDLEYAPTHEFGDPSRNIPKRDGIQRTKNAVSKKFAGIFANELKKVGL